MPDSSILTWFNSNGVVVGLLGSLMGFLLGFRLNLWIARRNDWNVVVDRVRAGLLKSRDWGSYELKLSGQDIDSLIHQASWIRRVKIQAVLHRHAAISTLFKHDKWSGRVYTPQQEEEMRSLRDRMLILVKRM